MNVRRAFIIAFGVLSLFIGLLTGQRIYYAVFVTLCAVIVISVVISVWVMVTLRYSQSVTENTVHKGDEITLRIHLQSYLPLPIKQLKLHYSTVDSSIVSTLQSKSIWLNPLGNTYCDIIFTADYSGSFRVGLTGFTIYCPFGLYSIYTDIKRFRYNTPIELLVLPHAVMPQYLNLDSRMTEGSNATLFQSALSSTQVDYPRNYIYGDTIRDIHWKLSMRTGELLSKTYEDTTHPKLILLIDCAEHSYTGLEGIMIEDTISESASSILNYLLTNNLSVRLIAYSGEIIRLTGESYLHFEAFNECLARLSFHGTTEIKDVLRSEPLDASAGVIIITTDISSSLFDELVWLKLRGIQVKVLCVSCGKIESYLSKTIDELANQGIKAVHLAVGDDVLQAVGEL